MKLWLISQCANNDLNTYDAAVVAAPTEEDARGIHPIGTSASDTFAKYELTYWCEKEDVKVKYLGEAKPGQLSRVILASFNSG